MVQHSSMPKISLHGEHALKPQRFLADNDAAHDVGRMGAIKPVKHLLSMGRGSLQCTSINNQSLFVQMENTA